MKAKIVSAEGKELGPKEEGEIWLTGPNIFKGYWKNEAATKDCMDNGYFKTGDIGYFDTENNFYITDRVKELIKYKGFQVAPAELEGKLLDHPDVDDVAVVGIQDKEQHTEVPRAYVVPKEGKNTQQHGQKIVEWLGQKVANHKRLRGGVVFIDEIPKSASGKILRRVLRDRVKAEAAKAEPRAKL